MIKNWFKALVGSVAAILWLVIFSVGLFLSARIWMDNLSLAFDIRSFGAAIIIFTPTNVLLLTCLAALVGGCASNLVYENPKFRAGAETVNTSTETIAFLTENPAASMLRGFAVYLTFLAGVYISSDQPFDKVGPDQYARVAGAISIIAFAVGYDPTMFRSILGRFTQREPSAATSHSGVPPVRQEGL